MCRKDIVANLFVFLINKIIVKYTTFDDEIVE